MQGSPLAAQCAVRRRDPERPLNVDTSRPLRANSGHSRQFRKHRLRPRPTWKKLLLAIGRAAILHGTSPRPSRGELHSRPARRGDQSDGIRDIVRRSNYKSSLVRSPSGLPQVCQIVATSYAG